MQTFNAAWLQKIRDFIATADVISCDVFDTLIHRKTRKPTDIFELVSEQIIHENAFPRDEHLIVSFPTIRVYAEQKARDDAFVRYKHWEVSIKDIYDSFQEITNCSDEIRHYLLEKERYWELQLTYPNPIMLNILNEALNNGKKIILCSDMYSAANIIQNRIEHAGYPKNLPIIVSCENSCSKHDGKLFSILKKKFPYGTKIVHIGDNVHADVKMAQKNDIPSLHFSYKEDIDRIFLSHIASTEENLVNSLSHGIARYLLIQNEGRNVHDLWYLSGISVFGPLFVGYFLWLINNLKKNTFSKILFLARDGYFFHKMYQKWAKQLDLNTPSEYAYVSRGTLLYPSLSDMNWDRLWYQFGGKKNKSLKEICEKIGLPTSLYLKKTTECNIFDVNQEFESNSSLLHKFFVSLGPDILNESKKKRDIVSKYLRKFIPDHDSVALCDIGWAGNIQGSMSRILRTSGDTTKLEGFYFGTFPWSEMNASIYDTFHGYLVNGDNIQDYNDILLNGGVELLEFATMAPHGTTLGYRETETDINPILETSTDDQRMQKLSSAIQSGAWDFANAIMEILPVLGEEEFITRSWADSFIDFVSYPSIHEARTFGVVTHSDAPGATCNRTHLISTPRSSDEEDIEYAEKRSFWKYGFETLYKERCK